MQKKYMGRSRLPPSLVPLAQAAEILKVGEAVVLTWVERGLLEQVWVGKEAHYRRDQVEGLEPILPKGPIDFATLSSRADLAFATSRNVERRLNDLLDLLGANRNSLDMKEWSILELDRDVSAALLDAEPPTLEEVRRWAGIFFAVDEAYLFLVEKYVDTEEPWKKFMDLGFKLVVDAPYDRFEEEPALRTAYVYLGVARTQLRQASYFYCQERHGKSLTYRVFGRPGSVTDRIIGLLYHH
jgi:hypothetical protein